MFSEVFILNTKLTASLILKKKLQFQDWVPFIKHPLSMMHPVNLDESFLIPLSCFNAKICFLGVC